MSSSTIFNTNIQHQNGRPRVIVTMTTIPSRIQSNLVLYTLKSLNAQTLQPDKIYVTIPGISRKTKKSYPSTKHLEDLCTIVKITTDYGPISKIIGGILMETDPNTIMISCDDDIIFPSNYIEKLYTKSLQYPNHVIGARGLNIGRFPGYITIYDDFESKKSIRYLWTLSTDENNPSSVDIVFGSSGIVYRRGFFPATWKDAERKFISKVFLHPDIFKNDDILISGYLSTKNIPRILFTMPKLQRQISSDGLSSFQIPFYMSVAKSIMKSQDWGMFKNRVKMPYDVMIFHSVGCSLLFLVIISILLISIVRRK